MNNEIAAANMLAAVESGACVVWCGGTVMQAML